MKKIYNPSRQVYTLDSKLPHSVLRLTSLNFSLINIDNNLLNKPLRLFILLLLNFSQLNIR